MYRHLNKLAFSIGMGVLIPAWALSQNPPPPTNQAPATGNAQFDPNNPAGAQFKPAVRPGAVTQPNTPAVRPGAVTQPQGFTPNRTTGPANNRPAGASQDTRGGQPNNPNTANPSAGFNPNDSRTWNPTELNPANPNLDTRIRNFIYANSFFGFPITGTNNGFAMNSYNGLPNGAPAPTGGDQPPADGAAAGGGVTVAIVDFRLPSGAQLYIDETPVESKNNHLRMVFPNLDPNRTYSHAIRTVWTDSDREVDFTQHLALRAGDHKSLTFLGSGNGSSAASEPATKQDGR